MWWLSNLVEINRKCPTNPPPCTETGRIMASDGGNWIHVGISASSGCAPIARCRKRPIWLGWTSDVGPDSRWLTDYAADGAPDHATPGIWITVTPKVPSRNQGKCCSLIFLSLRTILVPMSWPCPVAISQIRESSFDLSNDRAFSLGLVGILHQLWTITKAVNPACSPLSVNICCCTYSPAGAAWINQSAWLLIEI